MKIHLFHHGTGGLKKRLDILVAAGEAVLVLSSSTGIADGSATCFIRQRAAGKPVGCLYHSNEATLKTLGKKLGVKRFGGLRGRVDRYYLALCGKPLDTAVDHSLTGVEL